MAKRPIGLFRPTPETEDQIAQTIANEAARETASITTLDRNNMLAEIGNGVPKERSTYRNRPDFDQVWDDLVQSASEVPEGAIIDIPNEIDW